MNFSTKTVLWLALSSAFGCSAEKDATSRRLDELQAEISRLKASHIAVQERLEAVESQAAAPAAVTEALVDDDRPELAVVKVSPEPAQADPPAQAPEVEEDRTAIVGDQKGVEQVDQAAPPGRGRR